MARIDICLLKNKRLR